MIDSNKGHNLEIRRIIWLEDIVEKLIWKHNVEEREILEVLENNPVFQCIGKTKSILYNSG